jgi:uncharacterized protein DUF1571
MRLPSRVGLVLVVVLAAAFTDSPPPTSSPPAPPPPRAVASPPDLGVSSEHLRLIAEARRAWAAIDDYTCAMVRRERVRERLHPEETMLMKARRQPFSIYFRWTAPRDVEKQEACYVAGRNGGKMRARGAGVLGAFGFVSVDPNDPRAREHSNNPITEAGVGRLIERLGREWAAAQTRQMSAGDADFDGRPCRRVEVAETDAGARVVVHFDRETHLPIRAEWYDGDELREADAYTKMRLNVGLGDGDFDY